MKKNILLSFVAFSTILQAQQTISDIFENGKVSGNIREFSISRDVTDTRSAKSDYTRKANAIGGHLKYETAKYNGINLATAFYTTKGFALNDNLIDYTKVDPTLLGVDNQSYSILGEAYIDIKYNQTSFRVGRQKLTTPLANADDVRMIPNFFEAYILSNKNIKNTTLTLAHIDKFAQGTFGRAYNGGLLSTSGGYSGIDTRDQVNKFVNMGKYAVGKDTNGVTLISIVTQPLSNLKIQFWDYYAHDILNAVYADASFSWNCLLNKDIKPFLATQIIKENNVGNHYLNQLGGDGKIDSFYYGVKFGINVENFTTYVAYSKTTSNDKDDASYNNAIISTWGGIPAYTQGMVTRHMFLAGTSALKTAISYNFKKFGEDIKTILYYGSYTMDRYNGYTENDTDEVGFDIIYNTSFMKNLQLRFRGNFSNDFYVKETSTDSSLNGTVGWSEYRFIANYNF